ncbi:MAG TPA: right-handed parallel beta-helix repeat-containing protein [Tepidisphaeraceae bacterium]|jgi:hypothetical protein
MSKKNLIESLESRTLFSAYVVAPIGSDSAAGTAAAPWATLQKAFDSVKAGDTVTVRAGNYAGASKFSMKGTAGAPITFKADPGVNIVSNATKQTALNVGIELSGYDASSASTYVTLDGFNVNNASDTMSTDASSGFRIRFTDHVTIRNSSATNCGWMGFYTSRNTNLTIENSESAFNNKFVDPLTTARNHGIYVDGGSSYVNLLHNRVHDNNGNGIHTNQNSHHLVIDGNTLYNNGLNGGSALNNDGLQNSVIRNNLLYNNQAKGISIYNTADNAPATGNSIINNTVIQPGGSAALTVLGAATGTQIFNNIFETPTGPTIYFDDAARAGTMSDNNVFISTSSRPFQAGASRVDFATWKSTYGFDTHSVFSTEEKLFIDPANRIYMLSKTSPARHRADASKMPSTDLWGAPRFGDANDAGAFRYWLDGDTNFDGVVTPDDYMAIDSNLGQTAGGVFNNGDLNHDGVVTPDDYIAIDSNLGNVG